MDCKLSAWGNFTACSAPCGGGQTYSHRTVLELPKYGGKSCGAEALREVKSCNEQECKGVVNCEWGRRLFFVGGRGRLRMG